jgi:hypothetical protein
MSEAGRRVVGQRDDARGPGGGVLEPMAMAALVGP